MKVDWKDDIFEEERLYNIVDAPDDKKYIRDVTMYTQQGDSLGALQPQQTGEEVNHIQGSRNITLTAAAWTGSAAPYTQVVAVAGTTEEDVPGVGIIYLTNCTRVQQKAINKAVSYIYDVEIGVGKITVRATQKPAVDITPDLGGVV